MPFSSLTFLCLFLPTVLALYFLLPRRFSRYVLLAANMLFFLWADGRAFLLLLVLTLSGYLCGLSINRYRRTPGTARIPLVIGVAMNLICLFGFKFQLLLPQTYQGIFGKNEAVTDYVIPLGISIFVLQGISYLVDIYLNKGQVEKNLVQFAVYLSFFPQMICGPIVRYSDVRVEMNIRRINQNTISRGYGMFIRGLGKKLLLADTMLVLWNEIKRLDYSTISLMTAWLGITAFAFGIFFYFSGYSEMARGIAKIMGFELPLNYNYPYISKTIVEFWRRWNISLTVWCKAYFITPLGKQRKSFLATLLKVVVLWIMMGMWYGGQANHLLWAVFLAVLIIIEKLFLSSILEKLPGFIQSVYTKVLVMMAWVIFANDDVTRIPGYWKAMFTGNADSFQRFFSSTDHLFDNQFYYFLSGYGLIFLISFLLSGNLVHRLSLRLEQKHPTPVALVRTSWETALTLLCLVAVLAGRGLDQTFFVHF